MKLTKNDIPTLSRDRVLSVYTGRPGCCCGCKGIHRYPSDPKLRALAGTRRGYEVSEDEVNDRHCTKVLNTLKANADKCNIDLEYQSGHIFLELKGRWFIAYLRP